jgi:hypothetical protein
VWDVGAGPRVDYNAAAQLALTGAKNSHVPNPPSATHHMFGEYLGTFPALVSRPLSAGATLTERAAYYFFKVGFKRRFTFQCATAARAYSEVLRCAV